MLSYKVFLEFFDEKTEDAKSMLGKACFEKWVETRKNKLKQPHESFRRVLTAHVCGLDGRKPFPEKVEKSLLVYLRRRQTWECFAGTESTIGIRGFRNPGYHEQKNDSKLAPEEKRVLRKRKREATNDAVSFYRADPVEVPLTKLRPTERSKEGESDPEEKNLDRCAEAPENVPVTFAQLFEWNKMYNMMKEGQMSDMSSLESLAYLSSAELALHDQQQAQIAQQGAHDFQTQLLIYNFILGVKSRS